jgi:hypothetical protein
MRWEFYYLNSSKGDYDMSDEMKTPLEELQKRAEEGKQEISERAAEGKKELDKRRNEM